MLWMLWLSKIQLDVRYEDESKLQIKALLMTQSIMKMRQQVPKHKIIQFTTRVVSRTLIRDSLRTSRFSRRRRPGAERAHDSQQI